MNMRLRTSLLGCPPAAGPHAQFEIGGEDALGEVVDRFEEQLPCVARFVVVLERRERGVGNGEAGMGVARSVGRA